MNARAVFVHYIRRDNGFVRDFKVNTRPLDYYTDWYYGQFCIYGRYINPYSSCEVAFNGLLRPVSPSVLITDPRGIITVENARRCCN